MSKITNIKVQADNLAEASFNFNKAAVLYNIQDILSNPKNKNISKYRQQAPNFEYASYPKVQIGAAGCQEFYDESSNESKGFIKEASSYLDGGFYYPLSDNLKGVKPETLEKITEAIINNKSPKEFFKEKENNVEYSKATEIVYNKPFFMDGYVTSRNSSENLLKFNENSTKWSFDNLNIDYSKQTVEDYAPNFFNCEAVTSSHTDSYNAASAIDQVIFKESNYEWKNNLDSVFIAGPFEFPQEISDNSYFNFSLFAKASRETELKGLYIIPYKNSESKIKNYRLHHGDGSYGTPYILSEDSFESCYPEPLSCEYSEDQNKVHKEYYLKVSTDWKRLYKIFKYEKKNFPENKFYAVVCWPYRTCQEQINLKNSSQFIEGTNRAGRNHTSKKTLRLAGFCLEKGASPSTYDSRYILYNKNKSDQSVARSNPLIFNLDLSQLGKISPSNWIISYKRRFESKGVSDEDIFADSLILDSGIYRWGYQGNKIYATASSAEKERVNSEIKDFNHFYNCWEEVFIYPIENDGQKLRLEVIGENINKESDPERYYYRMDLLSDGSPCPKNYKGIPFNFILGGIITKGQSEASIALKNGFYRDLYITSKNNIEKLKKDCIKIYNITDNTDRLNTVLQTDFIEEK